MIVLDRSGGVQCGEEIKEDRISRGDIPRDDSSLSLSLSLSIGGGRRGPLGIIRFREGRRRGGRDGRRIGPTSYLVRRKIAIILTIAMMPHTHHSRSELRRCGRNENQAKMGNNCVLIWARAVICTCINMQQRFPFFCLLSFQSR